MRLERQRANTLIEVAAAIAIIAVAAGSAVSAFLATGRHRIERDRREALEAYVRQELRTAVDIVKYSGRSLAPATASTTVPMPGGSPLPAIATLSVRRSGGAWQIDVTAQSTGAAGELAALHARVDAQAPLPGAQLPHDGLVPAPPDAP